MAELTTEERIARRAHEESVLYSCDDYQRKIFRDGWIAAAKVYEERIKELNEDMHVLDMNIVELQLENAHLSKPWYDPSLDLPPEVPYEGDDCCRRRKSSADVLIKKGSCINRGYYSYARMQWEWNGCKIPVDYWMNIPKL